MPALTITSLNAIYMLTVPGVFDAPQRLEAFGVDEAFDTDPVESAVTQTGVDGIGTAGLVPREVPQTVTLLASSSSFIIFDNWIQAMDLLGDIIYANAVITLPSIGRKFTCYQGALTRYPTMPSARRTLQQRQFQITWLPPGQGQPAIFAAPA